MASAHHRAAARLTGADRAAVRNIEHGLRRLSSGSTEDPGPAPAWLAGALRELLALDHFAAYRPAQRSDGTWSLGSMTSITTPGFLERYDEALHHFPSPFYYDPLRPERGQRNRVRLFEEVHPARCPGEACVIHSLWPRLGMGHYDQIRALVCDGPLLVAWVGGMREARFRARDKDLLSALVPALRRGLAVRRRLVDAHSVEQRLEGALNVMGAPVFLVRSNGEIAHANVAGRALSDGARTETRGRLRAAIAGRDLSCEVIVLDQGGGSDLFLVVVHEPGAKLEWRLGRAKAVCAATPREVEVLRWVALGDSNKEIALRLKCHEGSVERHVTSLLRKARCESRSRLLAWFWTS